MATLGFGFGVRDFGVDAAFGKTQKHLKSVNRQMADQGKIAKKTGGFVRNMMKGITGIQLSGIATQIEQITGSAQSLTTSMEGQYVQLRASAKPFAAQMGKVGQAAARTTSLIAGMADALNTSSDQVGKTMLMIETSGPKTQAALKATGLGVSELIMLQKSLGVETELMVGHVHDLTNSWGFTSEQARDNLETVHAVAKANGTLSTVYQTQAKAIDLVNKAGTSANFSPERVDQMLKSTAVLEAAFRTTNTAEGAQQGAIAVLEALTDVAAARKKMFIGLDSKDTQFFEDLAVNVGFKGTKELFDQGPAETMAGMLEMMAELDRRGDKSGMARLRVAMGRINPALTFFADKGQESIDVLKGIQASAKTVPGDLVKTAKQGFSTGRTLAESFDRIRERSRMAFRELGTLSNRRFLRNQRRGAATLKATMTDLVKDKGPLGKLIEYGAILDKTGLAGVFQQMGVGGAEFGAAIGLATRSLADMSAKLGPMMPAIKFLTDNLLTIEGLTFVGLSTLFLFPEQVEQSFNAAMNFLTDTKTSTKFGKKMSRMISESWKWAVDQGFKVQNVVIRMANRIASTDWSAVGDEVQKKLSEMFTSGNRKEGEKLSPEAKDFFAIDSLVNMGKAAAQWVWRGIKSLWDGQKNEPYMVDLQNFFSIDNLIDTGQALGRALAGGLVDFFKSDGLKTALDEGKTVGGKLYDGILEFWKSDEMVELKAIVIDTADNFVGWLSDGIERKWDEMGGLSGVLSKLFTFGEDDSAIVNLGKTILALWLGSKVLGLVGPALIGAGVIGMQVALVAGAGVIAALITAQIDKKVGFTDFLARWGTGQQPGGKATSERVSAQDALAAVRARKKRLIGAGPDAGYAEAGDEGYLPHTLREMNFSRSELLGAQGMFDKSMSDVTPALRLMGTKFDRTAKQNAIMTESTTLQSEMRGIVQASKKAHITPNELQDLSRDAMHLANNAAALRQLTAGKAGPESRNIEFHRGKVEQGRARRKKLAADREAFASAGSRGTPMLPTPTGEPLSSQPFDENIGPLAPDPLVSMPPDSSEGSTDTAVQAAGAKLGVAMTSGLAAKPKTQQVNAPPPKKSGTGSLRQQSVALLRSIANNTGLTANYLAGMQGGQQVGIGNVVPVVTLH